jgi:hypothetical protein
MILCLDGGAAEEGVSGSAALAAVEVELGVMFEKMALKIGHAMAGGGSGATGTGTSTLVVLERSSSCLRQRRPKKAPPATSAMNAKVPMTPPAIAPACTPGVASRPASVDFELLLGVDDEEPPPEAEDVPGDLPLEDVPEGVSVCGQSGKVPNPQSSMLPGEKKLCTQSTGIRRQRHRENDQTMVSLG